MPNSTIKGERPSSFVFWLLEYVTVRIAHCAFFYSELSPLFVNFPILESCFFRYTNTILHVKYLGLDEAEILYANSSWYYILIK